MYVPTLRSILRYTASSNDPLSSQYLVRIVINDITPWSMCLSRRILGQDPLRFKHLNRPEDLPDECLV